MPDLPLPTVPLYKGYIFDLDGTIYLGDELLTGAAATIAQLRELDRRVLFLSNNPTKAPAAYVAKLKKLGIAVTIDDVLNTIDTMTDWLLRFHPRATVFPIAEAPLIDTLRAAGIRMSDDPAEIDIVIASYDRTFDYRKLQIAFDAISVHKRARLVATNPDRYCPFPNGRGEPDAGAIIGAIEGCTGVKCEQNVGKPDPFMLKTAFNRLGLHAHECVMVGDRLTTDIRMAIDAAMASALVLTGETTPEMLAAQPPQNHPTFVLDHLDQLLPARR
ncbi:MAG: HAD-IIA family hydrolase [Chloroflexota bacterium]|nr:HAD-IIA family hydrolase [Chloroflexota bacterium]